MSLTGSDPDSRPALDAPPGITSNLIDPPSQGYMTIILMTTFLSLTTPIVLIRIYTRHFINRCLWWDDCGLPLQHLNDRLEPRAQLTGIRCFCYCLGLPASSETEGLCWRRPDTALDRTFRACGDPLRDPSLWKRRGFMERLCCACGTFHAGKGTTEPSHRARY